MKIYYDSGSMDEWSITSTLKLEDDGTFLYNELWGCYVGSAGGGARGRWWQSGNTIFFHTERAEGNTYLDLLPGLDRIAAEGDNIITFSEGLTYHLRLEPTRNLQQPPRGSISLSPLSPVAVTNEENVGITQEYFAATAPETTEPLKPSPELADLISRWVQELSAGSLKNRIANLGKQFNVLPLHTNMIYMWALNSDGVVVWLDHEAFGDTPELETNPLTIYAAMVHGARAHRELAELIPPCPEGVRHCKLCGGMGWTKSEGEVGENCCFMCQGFGWYTPAAQCRSSSLSILE